MKKKILSLSIAMLCSVITLLFTVSVKQVTANNSANQTAQIEEIINEVFDNVQIESCETLYGMDGSDDFIYVTFKNSGYVIFYNDTMAMLEYSLKDKGPYSNILGKKYYAGPFNYYFKENEIFLNITNDTYFISENQANSMAVHINETLSDDESYANKNVPKIDEDHLIKGKSPKETGTHYIANNIYFSKAPTHGDNIHGTCGSVAAQLLLEYNNFYNDRRIIATEHLNGGWNNAKGNDDIFDPGNYSRPEYNPNVCLNLNANLDSVDPELLGSNDDFYKHVIGAVEPGALNCVDTVTEIKVNLAKTITTITVTKEYQDGRPKETISNTVRDFEPGDKNDKITEHTHGGSLPAGIEKGLKTVLNARIPSDQFEVKHSLSLLGAVDSTPIKAEIEAGRPVIIGMYELFGGINHWVVGYGYHDYTYASTGQTYSGYVAHFGWGDEETSIWINESWCNSYVSLNLKHQHNLNIDTGRNFGNDKREVRCSECGYRTAADLYFTNLQGNVITGCRYNMSGEINIPDKINDVTIEGIAASAFENQTEITMAYLPAGITQIVDNAFAGCTSLTDINIREDVTSIGKNAFKNCSLLESIYIPATTYLCDGAFAGCYNMDISISEDNPNFIVQNNIVYNKAQTKIVTSGKISSQLTIPETVTEIGEYAFYSNSNLTKIIIDKQIAIGNYAFCNCDNLENVYFYSYEVPTLGLSAFENTDFTLYVPQSKRNEYVSAFMGYTNDITSIPVTVTFVVEGTVKNTLNTFYGANIANVSDGFKIGYNFDGWYDSADYTGELYSNGGIWDITTDITLYAKFAPRSFYISFYGDGSENLTDKLVTYDQPIGSLPVPVKTGHTFIGWKDERNVFYDENTIWKKTSNLALTSEFTVNLYDITFDAKGGRMNVTGQTVAYGSVINSFPDAFLEDYVFLGWNTKADGSGDMITAPYTYNITDDLTLYAKYEEIDYNVSFDNQGGINGAKGVNAEYNAEMPALPLDKVPVKTGYTFAGYYSLPNGAGVKYYNADLTSANVWDKTEPQTIYAFWIPNEYTVRLQTRYPGENGKMFTSVSASDIKYISYKAVANEKITIWTTHTTGDPYLYLYDANLTVLASNDDGNGNRDAKIEYMVIAGANYVIGFRSYSSTATSGNVYLYRDISATYGAAMPHAAKPEQSGYVFQGYFSEENGGGVRYYTSDMASANIWNIAAGTPTIIYSHWTPEIYSVTLDMQGGSVTGMPETFYIVQVQYLYEMPAAPMPSKYGYIFKGYYTEINGGGTQYYDSNMTNVKNWDIASSTTLFAYWQGNQYVVSFDRNGGSGGSINTIVTYGAVINVSGLVAPTRTGYIFLGYYDMDNKQYFDSDMSSNVIWDKTTAYTLKAKWKNKSYTISLNNIVNCGTAYSSFTARYGEPLPQFIMRAPEREGYAFVGYFREIKGQGRQFYKMVKYNDQHTADIYAYGEYLVEGLSPIGTWDIDASITLYAHWGKLTCEYSYSDYWIDNGKLGETLINLVHNQKTTVTAKTYDGYDFSYFLKDNDTKVENSSMTFQSKLKRSPIDFKVYPEDTFMAMYTQQCITAGTLITLADGRQVPVETLNGNEELLVWNLFTGQFDRANILFIDRDPAQTYKVINLYFSDGTVVKVVSEHAFWDCDLNKYVYLRQQNSLQYIGHWFSKQGMGENGEMYSSKVQLVNVEVKEEYTTLYSPVTYKHLCYYVNGMLSIPGGIEGLFNIFEVDGETMAYDEQAMLRDIELYGLYTYEEFSAIFPVSEDVFNAFSAEYLKVSIGKGLINLERLGKMINQYAVYLE